MLNTRWHVTALTVVACVGGPAVADEPINFENQIRPLLKTHCVECHGAAKQKGGLRLDARAFAMAGGEHGPSFVSGKSDKSLLMQRVTHSDKSQRMPPTGAGLHADEIAALKRWIDSGAKWPETAGDIAAAKDVRLGHWAWQPIRAVAVPGTEAAPGAGPARNEIDRFVSAKLRDKGLSRSPEADRATLIRRLSFDLLGLPPSPEAVEKFVTDADPLAYEKLVDRLLASPHYGERWARHWLDIAHYADTHGFERDQRRDNAWRYRDWVIKALNADMPYDQFLRDQVAGDVLRPNDREAVTATGFLAAGPWDFVGQAETPSPTIKRAARADDLDDMATQVMATTCAVTVNCARCHDHKLDPISQREYYALWAVFAGVKRGDRVVSPIEEQQGNARRKDLEAKIAAATATAKSKGVGRSLSEVLRHGPPDATAVTEWNRTIDALKKELAALPPPDKVYAVNAEPPAPVKLLSRGDPEQPQADVGPGTVRLAMSLPSQFGDSATTDARRRIALANWLADPANPLPRRVIVNRLWQHHFGTGLVETPSDFGLGGGRPSHPELLDWLAGKLLQEKWSLKALHRLICTSATYRQSSIPSPDPLRKAQDIDSGNRLLWRQNPRRLDAESVRDASLMTAGILNRDMYGPGYRDFDYKEEYAPVYTYVTADKPELHRRSIYRFVVRTTPHNLMTTLDCPNPANLTPIRTVTTTALQALAMLNHDFMVRQADHFAARLQREHPNKADAQVARAFSLAFSRPATDVEVAAGLKLVEKRGLSPFCRYLLNANEFVYID